MEKVLRPESPEIVPESLQEHMELSHYIDVFRSSAERVRRVIFIVMVFSVIMLVAQWNTTELSWMPLRYKGLESIYFRAEKIPNKDIADAEVYQETGGRIWTREELRDYIKEFLKQRIERVTFVEIPGLGVTFDINDLGNFSGIAYTLLMTLLLFSIAREHENLYLALFKVRRLHDHGKLKSDGESTANYLYHSLAMSQVLNSPPTLAQWDPSKIKTRILCIIYIVPTLVGGYIIYENRRTLPVVHALGGSNSVMVPQYIFFAIVLALGVLAIIYSTSCDRRWESAFFYVNPELLRVRARPWPVWVGLRSGHPLRRRMWNQAVTKLIVTEKATRNEAQVLVKESVPIHEDEKISYAAMNELCDKLEQSAAKDAPLQKDWVSKSPREVKSSILSNGQWHVEANFFEHGPLRNAVRSHLGPEQTEPIHKVAELLIRVQLEGRHDELERLMHPSAVLVGPGFAGRFEPGTDSLKSYWKFGADAKVESLELGDFTLETRGATTAVVTCPFTVKYRLDDVVYEESGRDVVVLVHENRTWLVIWRTLLVEKAKST
jgi:hypothetical protein